MPYMYLKPEQYYIDFYDLITVHRVLDVVDVFQKTYQQMLKESKNTETPVQTRNHLNRMLYDQLFYALTDHYEKKKDVIDARIIWITANTLMTALHLGIITYLFSGLIILVGLVSMWAGMVFGALRKKY